jgi:hypothetical protein
MTLNYCPPGLYAFLVKIAEENKLSVKEVQTMFIRKVAQDLGYDCPHEEIGYSPTKKPFCKRCWTRLNQTQQAAVFKGKLIKSTVYEPVETFLDKFYNYKQVRESKFEHEI